MKVSRILIAALFAVCVMAVAGVSTAAANEEECIKVPASLHPLWNNSACTTSGSTNEWELFILLLAEWLVNGVTVATELLVEVKEELLLEDTNVPVIGSADVLCSGSFDGWVGPNSLDYLSEVLNLSGVAISNTPLSGTSLDCTAQKGCETNTTVLVWPVGFPVETEVELAESETLGTWFAILFFPTGGHLGWEIQNCLVFGLAEEDECTVNEAAAELTLVSGVPTGSFSDAFTELSGLKLANCTQGGTESGVVEGSGTFTVSGGGELTASSDNFVS